MLLYELCIAWHAQGNSQQFIVEKAVNIELIINHVHVCKDDLWNHIIYSDRKDPVEYSTFKKMFISCIVRYIINVSRHILICDISREWHFFPCTLVSRCAYFVLKGTSNITDSMDTIYAIKFSVKWTINYVLHFWNSFFFFFENTVNNLAKVTCLSYRIRILCFKIRNNRENSLRDDNREFF